VFEQTLADRCKPDPVTVADIQRFPDRILKQFKLPGHSGLTDMKIFGGPTDAFELANQRKCQDLGRIHGSNPAYYCQQFTDALFYANYLNPILYHKN
jgi:hypothetical protein